MRTNQIDPNKGTGNIVCQFCDFNNNKTNFFKTATLVVKHGY
jgi:hypothetical protein